MFRNSHRTSALVVAGLGLAAVGLAGPALASVSGPGFWIDGSLYRTVATPTDLAGTGAPDSTYGAIYSFGGARRNVAEAKPGDPDFDDDTAVDTGGIVRMFVCTVNRVPRMGDLQGRHPARRCTPTA